VLVAIVGCDYGAGASGGAAVRSVKGVGTAQGIKLVSALLELHNRGVHRDAATDARFVDFAARALGPEGAGSDGALTLKGAAQTLLTKVRGHRPAYPGAPANATFADELTRVARAIATQRRLAAQAVHEAALTRASVADGRPPRPPRAAAAAGRVWADAQRRWPRAGDRARGGARKAPRRGGAGGGAAARCGRRDGAAVEGAARACATCPELSPPQID
jgi:hypothetical protein